METPNVLPERRRYGTTAPRPALTTDGLTHSSGTPTAPEPQSRNLRALECTPHQPGTNPTPNPNRTAQPEPHSPAARSHHRTARIDHRLHSTTRTTPAVAQPDSTTRATRAGQQLGGQQLGGAAARRPHPHPPSAQGRQAPSPRPSPVPLGSTPGPHPHPHSRDRPSARPAVSPVPRPAHRRSRPAQRRGGRPRGRRSRGRG